MNRLRSSAFPWLACLWIFLAGLLAGCTSSTPPDAAPAPAGTTPSISADVLRPGDRIKIVYNDIPDPPTPVEQVIPEDGKILLPRGLEINVVGKKRSEVEREISSMYVERERIYRKLTVTIERMASFVSVGGEVRTPSSIVFRGDLTVLGAIDAAGGFTEYADRRDVILTRAATQKQIHVNAKKAIRDPKQNLPLYPGDSVHVPRSIW